MKLLVRLVPANNCFVNLPPSLIERILSKSLGGRSLVKLQSGSQEVVLAWSGDSSQESHTIDVPVEVGACYHLESGIEVDVSVVDSATLYEAIRVMVEPVTVEDWEMLELNAGFIEEQMVNQVATVKEGTTIPLWVNSSTVIRLSVKETVPNGVVKLEGAEVIVSPKPRHLANPSASDADSHAPKPPKLKKSVLRLQHYLTGNASTHLIIGRALMRQLHWSDGLLICVSALTATLPALARLNHSLLPTTTTTPAPSAALPTPPLFLRAFGSDSLTSDHAILHVNAAAQLNIHLFSRFLAIPQPEGVFKAARHLERILLKPLRWPSSSPYKVNTPTTSALVEHMNKWMASNAGRGEKKSTSAPRSKSASTHAVPLTNGTLLALGGQHYLAYCNIISLNAEIAATQHTTAEETRNVLAEMNAEMSSEGLSRTAPSTVSTLASMVPNLPGMASLQQIDQLREAGNRVSAAKTEGKLRATREVAQLASAQEASKELFYIDADAVFSTDTLEIGSPVDSAWLFPLDFFLSNQSLLSPPLQPPTAPSANAPTMPISGFPLSRNSSTSGQTPQEPRRALLHPPADSRHPPYFSASSYHGVMTLSNTALLHTNDDIGGLDTQWENATETLSLALSCRLLKQQLGLRSGGYLLLTGQHGAGKTMMLHALGHHFAKHAGCGGALPLFVNCSEFSGVKTGKVIDILSTIFRDAIFCQPALILLDDLDSLLPAENADSPQAWAAKAHHAQILGTIVKLMDCVMDHGHAVAVAATALSESALNADLQDPHFLLKHTPLPAPNLKARTQILQRIIRRKGIWLCGDHGEHLDEVSAQASTELARVALRSEGYLGADLEQLVDRAVHAASVRLIESESARFQLNVQTPAAGGGTHLSRSNSFIASALNHAGLTSSQSSAIVPPPSDQVSDTSSSEFTTTPDWRDDWFDTTSSSAPQPHITAPGLLEAQEGFVPTSLRGAALNVSSTTTWDDVGGLDSVKSSLRETIEWPTKYGFLFKNSPIRHRSGILLYGPSGCGKTLMASAIAKECGLNFISVKGPELLNKYIGQSEQSVRDTFARAQSAAPCVLFFDEFDSIAPRRGHDNTGVTDRVVNQFLTELDGVEGLEGVYVLAATSRPDLIDPALLRPGRLDKSYYIGYPDVQEREAILMAQSRKLTIASNVDFAQVAAWADTLTGADIQALLYNANLEAIHERLDEARHQLGTDKGSAGFAPERLVVLRHADLHSAGDVALPQSNLSLATRDVIVKKLDTIHKSIAAEEQQVAGFGLASSASSPTSSEVTVTMAHLKKAFSQLVPSTSTAERHRNEQLYARFMASRGTDFSDAAEARTAQKTTLA